MLKKASIVLIFVCMMLSGAYAVDNDFYLESTDQPMGKNLTRDRVVLIFNKEIGTPLKDIRKFIFVGEDIYNLKLKFILSGKKLTVINPGGKWIGKNIYITVEKYYWKKNQYFVDKQGRKLTAAQDAVFSRHSPMKDYSNYAKNSEFRIIKINPNEGEKFSKKIVIYFNNEPAGDANYLKRFFGTNPPRFQIKIKKRGKKIVVYIGGGPGNLIIRRKILGTEYFKDIYGNRLKTDYEFIYKN